MTAGLNFFNRKKTSFCYKIVMYLTTPFKCGGRPRKVESSQVSVVVDLPFLSTQYKKGITKDHF